MDVTWLAVNYDVANVTWLASRVWACDVAVMTFDSAGVTWLA